MKCSCSCGSVRCGEVWGFMTEPIPEGVFIHGLAFCSECGSVVVVDGKEPEPQITECLTVQDATWLQGIGISL